MKQWLIETDKYCSPGICKLLVANKCDLVGKRAVDYIIAKVSIIESVDSIIESVDSISRDGTDTPYM